MRYHGMVLHKPIWWCLILQRLQRNGNSNRPLGSSKAFCDKRDPEIELSVEGVEKQTDDQEEMPVNLFFN